MLYNHSIIMLPCYVMRCHVWTENHKLNTSDLSGTASLSRTLTSRGVAGPIVVTNEDAAIERNIS